MTVPYDKHFLQVIIPKYPSREWKNPTGKFFWTNKETRNPYFTKLKIMFNRDHDNNTKVFHFSYLLFIYLEFEKTC